VRVLVTGACGFVGSTLIRSFLESGSSHEILGFDNLSRSGSELNVDPLRRLGVRLYHGDLRQASDLEALPGADWVIDAAANPSVLAGVTGATSSRQLLEHNLVGTINMLEYCRKQRTGLVLLSTSRVYSMAALRSIPLEIQDGAFRPSADARLPGLESAGINEGFSTEAPVSLYGATKLASETLALEYGEAFDFPVWINRCGVLAGAGQFGRADQGIFSYWIHSWRAGASLRFIGFGGEGYQVRDALHPRDLAPLLDEQMRDGGRLVERIQNLSGGSERAMSLRQLSEWCRERFGRHEVEADLADRPNDLPWVVLSSGRALSQWSWQAQTSLEEILSEIAAHAEANREWLALSTGS